VVIDLGDMDEELLEAQPIHEILDWIKDDLPRWQIVDMQVED
jgi:hypothetical protein